MQKHCWISDNDESDYLESLDSLKTKSGIYPKRRRSHPLEGNALAILIGKSVPSKSIDYAEADANFYEGDKS